MPIKTRKYRKRKMKGGWPWTWRRTARVAPAPPPPPPPRPPLAPNSQYESAKQDILILIGVLKGEPLNINNSSWTLHLVYHLQLMFIFEIFKIDVLNPEPKQIFINNLKASKERKDLFTQLNTYINDFDRLHNKSNERERELYREDYYKDDYYSEFRMYIILKSVFETFNERTFTGNIYLNMGRLKEIYIYCNDVDKMVRLTQEGEFHRNTLSFLNINKKLHEDLRHYLNDVHGGPSVGSINLDERNKVAHKIFQRNFTVCLRRGYLKGTPATEEERIVGTKFEMALERVIDAAVKRATDVVAEDGEVLLEHIQKELLEDVYRLDEEEKEIRNSWSNTDKKDAAAASPRIAEQQRAALTAAEATAAAVFDNYTKHSHHLLPLAFMPALAEELCVDAAVPLDSDGEGNVARETFLAWWRKAVAAPAPAAAAPPPAPREAPDSRNKYHEGGDLSKPVQTTTIPNITNPKQTLW